VITERQIRAKQAIIDYLKEMKGNNRPEEEELWS